MKQVLYRWFSNILVGGLLFSSPALAERLDCKEHKAFGEGPSPVGLSENSSACSMTFGSSNSSNGNALLAVLLQRAPQEARQLRFDQDPTRIYRQRFNVQANGPFDAAVIFFQSLRLVEETRQQTSAVDAFDALFYVIAGSAADRHQAQYAALLDAYWRNRSSIAERIRDPFGTISQKERSEHSYGSLKLILGSGCFIAEINETRFIAGIAQSLRVEFRNCGITP